jgi:hypothetical protein
MDTERIFLRNVCDYVPHCTALRLQKKVIFILLLTTSMALPCGLVQKEDGWVVDEFEGYR